jgi:sulfonate dioxygenase
VPPGGGGDTVFASSVVAYERLSPDFRKRLEGIRVYHDGSRLAIPAREAGSVVRYEPVSSIHPLIRTHPVIISF